ncbi:MAG: hypothetical protein ABFD57_01085 [Smithella sp.]
MNTMQIPKQLMELNKITIDNTFNAILVMQDHSRRIASGVVEKAAWIPENGKKAINDWMSSYAKGIEGLKSASDKSYKSITNLFDKRKEANNQ